MFAAIRAGRGRIAGSWHTWVRGKWKADGEPINTTWNEFDESLENEVYVCGEIDDEGHAILSMNKLIQVAQPTFCIRRPSVLAQLALKTRRSKKIPDPGSLTPLYLDKQDG
jgi:tRNA A37 threonylcarbamoyladenosine modification protein TsaB